MALTRNKTWGTNEVLTSSALNTELNTIANSGGAVAGVETVSGRWTFSGGVVLNELVGTGAAGAGDVKIAEFRWDPASGTATDADGMYIDWLADDDGGTETIMARMGVELTDTAASSEDAEFEIRAIIGASLTKVASFGSAGNVFSRDVTVGTAGSGHDVTFYGDTSGKHLLWDQSADELALVGVTKLSFYDAAGGENIVASADGHLEVNAGTTLDVTAPTIELHHSSILRQTGSEHTWFHAVNNGNPEYTVGASATECFRIQPVFDSGAQTLNYVIFETKVAGAGSNKGEFRFQVDETSGSLVKIQDSGVTIAGTLAAGAGLTATTITASGVLKTDNATEATTTTDGSLQTDGGLSVVKDAVFGNDVKLLSDSAILSLGAGNDATLTHDGTTGVTIAANPVTITSAGASTWSTSSGALSLTSAAALNITPASGSAVVLDGTINVDAGVVTGATSITSTAFVGALTGNASGTAATVTGGTQAAITTTANLVTVGALNAGSITSGFGTINTGSSTITTTGAVSTGNLTVSGLFVAEASEQLVIGHTAALTTIGAKPHLQVYGSTSSGDSRVVIGRFSNSSAAPRLEFLKSHTDTIGAYAQVHDNDVVMEICAQVSDTDGSGDFISDVGKLIFEVDDASPATNQIGGAFFIKTTPVTGSTGVERLRINAAGSILVGTAALATSATDEFLYIPSMAGAPSGTPTDHSNLSAMVHDTTNNRFYLYDHVSNAWAYTSLT